MEDDINDTGKIMDAKFDRNRDKSIHCMELCKEVSPNNTLCQLKMTAIMPGKLMVILSDLIRSGKVSIHEVADDMRNNSKNLQNKLSSDDFYSYEKGIAWLYKCGQFAKEKEVKILIDAEYSYMNPGISLLAMAMMFNFNQENAVVWNTYQCYLKEANKIIEKEYEIIKNEGLCFGAKIVRGAYILPETMHAEANGNLNPIHDTYEDTCNMYDTILSWMLENVNNMAGRCTVMAATHNEESVLKVKTRMEELGISRDSQHVMFAQLMGMSDQVSYILGQNSYLVYKSFPYGTINETLPYLSRRAVENRSILQGARKERSLLKKEFRRRLISK